MYHVFRWLESVDEPTGFNAQVLNGLKNFQDQHPEQYTACCLLTDAMAVKLQMDYD